jgi:Transglycosylase-like domain
MRPIDIRRKKRLIYAGAGAVALAIPATAVALTVAPNSSTTGAAQATPKSVPHVVTVKHHRKVRTATQRGCGRLFTVMMGEGAANLIYSTSGQVSEHDLKVLGYMERCQRNPAAEGFVRGYDQYQAGVHSARVAAAEAAAARAAAAAEAQAAAAQPQQPSGQYQQGSVSHSQAQQSSSSTTASTSSGGGSSLPACTWQPESGGNPSAVNPSSGAGGYYQIMPSTWQAYGGSGAPQDAPLSEQTAIAQKIYSSQGPGAWTNC